MLSRFVPILTLILSATASGGEVVVHVLDVTTNAPLPSRVYAQGADGQWLFAKSTSPKGSAIVYDVERSATSLEKHTTVSAHPISIHAPKGKLSLTFELGKEYLPLNTTVDVIGDASQEVAVKLHRWIDMPSRGWYSGDTHTHRKVEDLPNVMLAEDLHVTLPLTYWVREAYQPASAGEQAGPIKAALITVAPHRFIWPMNTEYELFTVKGKSHTQGAVFVLNHKEPIPLATPPVAAVAKYAHDSGAILDFDKHTWNWSLMIVPIMNVDLFELANNHVWRTEFLFKQWTLDLFPKDWDIEIDKDGMTEWGWIDSGFKTYYALLNCGFRMRPTGGTASGVHPVPTGFGRVYVHVDGEMTYEKWMAGLNAGRSFVTTGPMLLTEFHGQPTGTVFANFPAGEVAITGSAESASPLDRIEVIVNGQIAKRIEPSNQPTDKKGFVSRIDAKIPLEHSAWIAVRCFENHSGGRFRYAHTAPAHFEIDGPVRPRKKEVTFFISRMEQELKRSQGVLTPADIAEYEKALAVYQEIARRAID